MKQPDWDQLLLRSEELVQQVCIMKRRDRDLIMIILFDIQTCTSPVTPPFVVLYSQDFSIPLIERDIMQIEQFSQKLRSKSVLKDPTTESLDASRLLAQEGLNPRKINQALQTFELRPTYEDVFRVETSTVDEYLQQVNHVVAATAVQDAQRSAVAAFESHMDVCMNAEWTRDKKELLDAIEPFSSVVAASPLTAAGVRRPPSLADFQAGGTRASRGQHHHDAGLVLRGRAAKYADVIQKINASMASNQKYAAIDDFASATAGETAGDKRTTIHRVWQALQRQLVNEEGSVYSFPPTALSQRESFLVSGSKKFLQENYVSYMQTVVHAHRTQAALGGHPGRLGLVHAFLRVREKERGALDFDQPGGADTTWPRLYTCLRAGFFTEAMQVAKSMHDSSGGGTPRASAGLTFGGGGGGHRDISALIAEWIDGGNAPLVGEGFAVAIAEAERLLRDTTLRGRDQYASYRIMIYALLAGSNRVADSVAREFPAVFPTIEDYLWFKLSIARTGAGSASSAAVSGLQKYSLSDLQKYLVQFQPSHYTHGGREPLLYVLVLVLTLQYDSAIAFLTKDVTTRDYRLDAVHIGACLWHAHALGRPTTSAASNGEGAAVGALVQQYGRSLIHGDVQLALSYYMLAAAVQGGSSTVKGMLLRELLVESRAYGLLLGAGGTAGEGGALASFLPDVSERSRVLEAMATHCEHAAQLEEAVELYMVAGRPRQALHIVCRQLSDAMEYSSIDPGPGTRGGAGGSLSGDGEVHVLVARGNAAVAAMDASKAGEDLAEIEAFEQLKTIRSMLIAAEHNDRGRVLQNLADLAFIPTEQYRIRVCVAGASSLHPAVTDRIQAVLLTGAESLAAAGKWQELHALVSFASELPNRVSQRAYERLNQLQAGSR